MRGSPDGVIIALMIFLLLVWRMRGAYEKKKAVGMLYLLNQIFLHRCQAAFSQTTVNQLLLVYDLLRLLLI